MALVGVVSIFAGGAIVKGLSDIAKAGDEVLNMQKRLALQGQDLTKIQNDYVNALKVTAQIRTMTISEALGEIKDLTYATGSSEEALSILPEVAKVNAILGAVTGKKTEGQVYPLAKSLEEMGLLGNDARKADAMKVLEGWTRDIEATGGKVMPSQMFQTLLYARAARFGWATPQALAEENPFITSVLPRLVQAYGSGGSGGGGGRGGQSGPGAALMSSFSKIVQGQISKTTAAEAANLGILEQNEPIEGSSKVISKFKGSEEFTRNPYAWVQDVLYPALKAKGITTDEQIIETLSRLMGTRTAADPMIYMALQGRARLGEQSPIEKDIRLQRGAKGIDEAMASI